MQTPTFGDRLKFARQNAPTPLTQEDLGALMRKDTITISKWERSQHPPRSRADYDELAYHLGCSVVWLRDGVGEHGRRYIPDPDAPDSERRHSVRRTLRVRGASRRPPIDQEPALRQGLTPAKQLVHQQFLDLLSGVPDEALVPWWQRMKGAALPSHSQFGFEDEPTFSGTLAERLKSARLAAGLTLDQAGRRLKSVRPDLPEMEAFEYETDPAYLAALESGTALPSATLLANLSVVYHVSPVVFVVQRPAAEASTKHDHSPATPKAIAKSVR